MVCTITTLCYKTRTKTRRYILKLCMSAFRNIFYNIYGEICGIPENVPRFLKNVFHIPEGQHLGLASLSLSEAS